MVILSPIKTNILFIGYEQIAEKFGVESIKIKK